MAKRSSDNPSALARGGICFREENRQVMLWGDVERWKCGAPSSHQTLLRYAFYILYIILSKEIKKRIAKLTHYFKGLVTKQLIAKGHSVINWSPPVKHVDGINLAVKMFSADGGDEIDVHVKKVRI